MYKRNFLFFFIAFLILWVFNIQLLSAQIITTDEMPRALYYYKMKKLDDLKDMKNMKDLFHTDKLLMGRNIFSGNVSTNSGRVVVDDGKVLKNQFKFSTGLFMRTLIYEEFSINTTFYKNTGAKAAQQWIPDFTYSIGRYHWKPNTWNFGYENYNSNKYSDNRKILWTKFKQGYAFLSYAHLLSESFINKIKIDNSTSIRFTYFARYAMNFSDLKNVPQEGLFSGKLYSGIYMRYIITWNIYLETALYYYFDAKRTKQPWDPDFAYGFGYFDWRAFRFSLNYSNYAINKFPWNKDQNIYPYYGFADGNFRVVFNYSW